MDEEMAAVRDHRRRLRAEHPNWTAEELAVAMMVWQHGLGWLDPAARFGSDEERFRPVTPANDDEPGPGAG